MLICLFAGENMSQANLMNIYFLETGFLIMKQETSDSKTLSPLRVRLLKFNGQVTFK